MDLLTNPKNGTVFGSSIEFDSGDMQCDAYTYGLARWLVLDKYECWGHDGVMGIGMYYFPESKLSLVFAHNQIEASIIANLELLSKALAENGLLAAGVPTGS